MCVFSTIRIFLLFPSFTSHPSDLRKRTPFFFSCKFILRIDKYCKTVFMVSCLRLVRQCRGFATQRPSSKRIGGALSLDHFLQRSKVISFYRTILRGCRGINNAQTRRETQKFVRDELERHRHVTDLQHVRYLLSTGKTEWDAMERYIGGM